MHKRPIIVLAAVIMAGLSVSGQTRWSLALHGGVPLNIPLPLKIIQERYTDISLVARYNSEPFRAPFYWMIRLARISGNTGWEFESIHHKLILDNRPPEVQWFSITHGFNMLFINHSHHNRVLTWRYGAGIVLAHPENRIHDLPLSEDLGILGLGYYIGGPVLNLAAGRELHITRRFFADAEVKLTAGCCIVPVANGQAKLGHLSVHFLFGFGYDFIRKT